MYLIQFTGHGLADVKGLPKNIKNALKKELREKLQVDPLACSGPLQYELKQFRSFHWRKYRVVFQIFEDRRAVAIVAVARRDAQSTRDVYKRLGLLVDNAKAAEKVLISLRGFTGPPSR